MATARLGTVARGATRSIVRPLSMTYVFYTAIIHKSQTLNTVRRNNFVMHETHEVEDGASTKEGLLTEEE